MRFHRFLHGLLLIVLLSLSMPHARAQEENGEAIVNASRTVAPGDVFEILGISGEEDAQFDWILTTDGSFIEATRETIFRTRLLQEGTYVLDGQSGGESGIRRLHLTIDVTAPREDFPAEEAAAEPVGLTVVTTNVPGDDNSVHLEPESSLLTLTPSPAFNGSIAGDLDIRRDTDGDGDASNDNDLGDTLFSTEHNPLHLWFASADSAVTIALSTDAEDGTPIRQEIAVTNGSAPVPTESVDVKEADAGRVSFSFPLDPGIDPAGVIYQWYFGDGWQSLEDSPSHTYLRNDTYDVHVIVRELSTSDIVAQGEGTLTITNASEIVTGSTSSGSASSRAASSVQSSPASGASSGSGSLVWTLLKILGVLLIAGGLGAAGVWGYKKFLHREGALQKALEQAETMLVKKQPGAPDAAATEPATMELKRATKTDTPVSEPFAPAPAATEKPAETTPTPAKDTAPAPVAPAPSWLQKGLSTTEEKQKSEAALPSTPSQTGSPPPLPGDQFPTEAVKDKPAPSVAPTSVAAAPTAPSFVPEDTEHPLSEDDLLPPWLKEDQTPAPSPLPSPVAPPAPPAPTPAPSTDTTPSWLTDATPPIAPVPAATPTPVEPPIAPPLPTPPAQPVPPPPPALEQPAAPVALAAPSLQTALPPPSSPQQSPASPAVTSVKEGPALTAVDQERLERERERKKRKRQRYRENVKKRNVAGPGSGSETTESISPAPVSAPVKVETKSVTKPSVPAPAKTEPKTVPKAPAPLPSPKPVTQQTQPVKPASPPTLQKPLAKNIPKAETPAPKASAQSDDKVAFVIKAEGIEKKSEQDKKNGSKGG